MFFKKMTKREQANTHKAAVTAFVFYLLALGGHALYMYFQGNKPPVTFIILMAGLFVFSPQIGYIIKGIHKKSPHHEGFFLTSGFYIGLLNFYECIE